MNSEEDVFYDTSDSEFEVASEKVVYPDKPTPTNNKALNPAQVNPVPTNISKPVDSAKNTTMGSIRNKFNTMDSPTLKPESTDNVWNDILNVMKKQPQTVMCPYDKDMVRISIRRMKKGRSQTTGIKVIESCLRPFLPDLREDLVKTVKKALDAPPRANCDEPHVPVLTAITALRNAYIYGYIVSRTGIKDNVESSRRINQKLNHMKSSVVNKKRSLVLKAFSDDVYRMLKIFRYLKSIVNRNEVGEGLDKVVKACDALRLAYDRVQKRTPFTSCEPDYKHPIEEAWESIYKLSKRGSTGRQL